MICDFVIRRLLSTDEADLRCDVVRYIKPFANRFSILLDDILENLLTDVVTRCLIVPDIDRSISHDDSFEAPKDIDENEEITLSRLVIFLDLISCPKKRATAALLLLQVPATSECVFMGEFKAPKSVDRLLVIADECTKVETGLRDALIEAIRMQHLKSLAAKYGICNMDIRDSQQVRATVGIISAQIFDSTGKLVVVQSLKDAVEFAGAWAAAHIDVATVYSRVLIHCSTISQGQTDEISTNIILSDCKQPLRESTKEVSSRLCFEGLQSILSLVPKAKLVCVVEDTCTHLFGMLHDIYLECENGFIIENSEISLEAETLCQSAIQIVGFFLDQYRETSGSSASLHPHSFTWINTELLVLLKVIRTLQIDYKIYLSPRAYKQQEACVVIVTSLCKLRAQEMAADQNFSDQQVITPELRRACALLNISTVFAGHRIMRELIGMSQSLHAITVARSIGSEFSCASSNALDAEMLLDATINVSKLISEMQAKVVRATSTAGSGGVMNSSKGHLESFSLSREMLRSIAIACPESHIERALDLLVCTDIVVAVQDRIQIPNQETKVGIDTFSLSDTNYTKDGILMTLSSVQGPVLRYAQQEVQRRWTFTKTSLNQKAVPQDLQDLVGILQRTENHVLASRVLLTTWHVSDSVGHMLRSSLLALGRKILSYREIDTSYAVSCLSAIPRDLMMRELKAVIFYYSYIPYTLIF